MSIVKELDKKVSQEIRELREGIQAIQRTLALQQRSNEKSVGETSACINSNDAETRSENKDENHKHGIVPRYSKLEFPSYNGTEDPLGWLY